MYRDCKEKLDYNQSWLTVWFVVLDTGVACHVGFTLAQWNDGNNDEPLSRATFTSENKPLSVNCEVKLLFSFYLFSYFFLPLLGFPRTILFAIRFILCGSHSLPPTTINDKSSYTSIAVEWGRDRVQFQIDALVYGLQDVNRSWETQLMSEVISFCFYFSSLRILLFSRRSFAFKLKRLTTKHSKVLSLFLRPFI